MNTTFRVVPVEDVLKQLISEKVVLLLRIEDGMATTELETASCSFSLNASLILVSGFRGRFLATGFDLCRW